MDPEAALKALLLGNTALMALLTGGIYGYSETGLNGISRDVQATQNAFGPDGYLKPCALVKVRSAMGNWGGLVGNEGASGVRYVFEIYLYDAYDWENLAGATNLVYATLQRGNVPAFGRTRYQNIVKDRDPALGNAPFYRMDFDLPGIVGGS